MEIGECRLRASVNSMPARRDRDRSDQDSEIQPASDLKILVQREYYPDGSAEELVIAQPRLMRALVIAFAYAEKAVHIPADLAAAAQKWFAPMHGIVIPFAPIPIETVTCD